MSLLQAAGTGNRKACTWQMRSRIKHQASALHQGTRLIHRHHLATRLTHWPCAVCLFFLLLFGLQVFNAHPFLHVGKESGFQYDNAILKIGWKRRDGVLSGVTVLFGHEFDTTGVLGVSGTAENPRDVVFPSWATIPSCRDVGTGRAVQFFLAWVFVATLALWLLACALKGTSS